MANWRKALLRLHGAYSDHTLRSYSSDFQAFAGWCRKKRLVAIPSSPPTVMAYVDAEGEWLKPSTIKRRLCGVRKIHQLCGVPDPTLVQTSTLPCVASGALSPADLGRPSASTAAFGTSCCWSARTTSSVCPTMCWSR